MRAESDSQAHAHFTDLGFHRLAKSKELGHSELSSGVVLTGGFVREVATRQDDLTVGTLLPMVSKLADEQGRVSLYRLVTLTWAFAPTLIITLRPYCNTSRAASRCFTGWRAATRSAPRPRR